MELTQLTQITIVLCSALAGGVLLRRIKQPPLIAYMLVGAILGPSGAGFVETSDNISILAEIGITLLLFIVGLELSLQAFKRVYSSNLLGLMALSICFVCASISHSGSRHSDYAPRFGGLI